MPMGRMCLLCVYATIPTMGMPHDVDMQYADVFLGAPLGTVLYAAEAHASELPQLRIGPPRIGPCSCRHPYRAPGVRGVCVRDQVWCR